MVYSANAHNVVEMGKAEARKQKLSLNLQMGFKVPNALATICCLFGYTLPKGWDGGQSLNLNPIQASLMGNRNPVT